MYMPQCNKIHACSCTKLCHLATRTCLLNTVGLHTMMFHKHLSQMGSHTHVIFTAKFIVWHAGEMNSFVGIDSMGDRCYVYHEYEKTDMYGWQHYTSASTIMLVLPHCCTDSNLYKANTQLIHMALICRNKFVVSDTEITLFYGSFSVDKLLTMMLFVQQCTPSVFPINTIHTDFDKFNKHSHALALSGCSIIWTVLCLYIYTHTHTYIYIYIYIYIIFSAKLGSGQM